MLREKKSQIAGGELTSKSPVAQETKLGWIISGGASDQNPSDRLYSPGIVRACSTFRDGVSLSKALQRFWELDELTIMTHGSLGDAECERLFLHIRGSAMAGTSCACLTRPQEGRKKLETP